jgi:hypothetical protein
MRIWSRRRESFSVPRAMFVQPPSRSRLIAMLRMVAMTWGAAPVLIWERSSSKVTSRT